MIWAIVGLLMIVLLVMRIAGMLGNGRTQAVPAIPDPAPGFKSAEQVQATSEVMPSEWCEYQGRTPPLRLKIRGQSEENYTRITRQQLATLGPGGINYLSEDQRSAFVSRIAAQAYVADWEGAFYPNGNPIPFSVDNLMAVIEGDQLLTAFVMENAHRLSPAWTSMPG